jgi:PAS domain S-box-containing protein
MAVFIFVAVIAVPAAVSFAAAWLFVLYGWETDYWLAAQARLLNNIVTGLSVAPLCLAIAGGDLGKLHRFQVRSYVEFGIVLIGLAGILSIASAWQATETIKFPIRLYAPLPFLLWAAVRFGPPGLSIALLVFAYDCISDSIAGQGLFTTGSPAANVLALEASLAVLSLPLMLLAALMQERKHKEEALRESEARFRNMAEHAPVMIWITDPMGYRTYVNKRWTDFTGTVSEQAFGFLWLDRVHAEDRKLTAEIFLSARQRNEAFRMEYRVRRHDGEHRWVIDSASPRFGEGGEFLGYIGSIIDITERKRAEEALRESEERLARTEKFSIVMVTHTDLEGRWLKVPPTLCELLGYTEQELLGRRFDEVTHADDIDPNLNQRLRLLRGEINSFDLEKRYIRKDGGIVWVYINVSVVMDANGIPVHCISYIRDITERKRAEHALRESEERLQLALEAGRMGIWDWDKRTNVLEWSSEHFTIMGLAPFSVTPTYQTWLERVHLDDLPIASAAMERAIAERSQYRSEYRVLLSDGSSRWVESRGEPIFDRNGECVRVMGVIVDITERNRAESRLNVQYHITRVLSESASLADAAPRLIQTICECFAWQYGEIWQVNPESHMLNYLEAWHSASSDLTEFASSSREFNFALGVGLPGRVWESGSPAWMEDIAGDENFPRVSIAKKAGLESAFGFPVILGGETLSVMAFFSREVRKPDQELLQIMDAIGRQIGQFIEHKRADEALREGEFRNRAILESALDSIITIDHQGRIMEFNPAAEKTFGYKRAEAIGKQMADLIIPHAVRDKHYRGLAHYLATGDGPILDKRLEMTAMRADGTEIPIELAVTRIGTGGAPMFTGYIRDITQRKQAEEEIHRLKERLEAENVYLRAEVSGAHRFGELLGQSESIRKVLKQVRQVAVTDMAVLILGETGTGKELVARAVHARSARRERPLVKVNCSALPSELIESELFGHEKGSFTGASARQIGRFELADRGTIFLDEIGDLPLSLQAKLLRVLQEGEFERLGSSKTIRANVRVIAATNRDLSEAMREGSFRSDLYYRLAVYPIQMPPLRERKEDIGLLVQAFLEEASRRLGRSFEAIPRRVLETLERYDWPGNVRELQNVIERAVVTSTGRELQLPEGWESISLGSYSGVKLGVNAGISDYEPSAREATLEEFERKHIVQVLEQTRWRIEGPKGAAVILGLNPSTLRSRMHKLGIVREGRPPTSDRMH